jgi:hypothetical protein
MYKFNFIHNVIFLEVKVFRTVDICNRSMIPLLQGYSTILLFVKVYLVGQSLYYALTWRKFYSAGRLSRRSEILHIESLLTMSAYPYTEAKLNYNEL